MIRIAITDDHQLFRVGLRRMLADVKTLQIVGEAASGEEAVSLVRQLRPNVVLMDLLMPGIGGIEATRRIELMKLDTKVLMVTGCVENPFPMQALKAGATGYLSKAVTAEELVLAIKKAFLGKRYLSQEVAHNLALGAFDDTGDSPFDQLSGREMQIMMMVVNCNIRVNSLFSNSYGRAALSRYPR